MMHQLRVILLCSLCISASLAKETKNVEAKSTSTETSVKVSSGDVNTAEFPFESSHKIQQSEEFHTSHRISEEALKQHRDDLHQTMRSKEKPELDEQLGELIAADIKNNIEAKRLSEYERYIVEPLTTTVKPVLTTETVARSINEGLIDDFSVLEEAGSENKQASRIQIKKGPNGQDYEYEYVYYYYDDDEKNSEDDDVIIGSRKGLSTTSTTSAPAGKSRYSSIERGPSTSAPERNDIQSRGKARAQALPAPVSEEIVEERLPQVTRFPQRAKSAVSAEVAPEIAPGKKQHVKRPSLELVDSHSFVTDEKDKNSKAGPRIIETELSKSELLETVSKSTVEYVSSTTERSDDEEDTTPLMEKLAIDLYAILANENANEDDKKSDATTVSSEDDLTTLETETEKFVPTTRAPTTPTTTTTQATTTTTTTTEAPTTEAPRGRGSLSAGRNRFALKPKTAASTTEAAVEAAVEAATESSKPKNRFSRPTSSFSSRNSASRTSKASTTAAPEEEKIEKNEASTQSSSKLGSKTRNRFSLRTPATTSTTEKPLDPESTTVSRLLKPRPQFSLRNRSRSGSPTTTSTTESNDLAEENADAEKEEKPVEKSSSIVPRPTSRLNLNRPAARVLPGQKARTSPLNSRSRASSDENGEGNKSANENESDLDTTTQNNLNKLKSRPRIQISDSKAKSSPVVANRKVNPLISRRKFGATSTEAPADEEKSDDTEGDDSPKVGVVESEVEVKEDDTTQAAAIDTTSEQPRGLGLLNRRKIVNRRPGTLN